MWKAHIELTNQHARVPELVIRTIMMKSFRIQQKKTVQGFQEALLSVGEKALAKHCIGAMQLVSFIQFVSSF